MRILIVFLMAIFTSAVFAQDPIGRIIYEEKSEPTFPVGFNPDGKIGSSVLTLFAGFTNQSSSFSGGNSSITGNATGFNLAGELAFPVDINSTLFIDVRYGKVSSGSLKSDAWSFGAGVKLFGGMKQK